MADLAGIFWQAVQRRASKLTPAAAALFLKGIEVIKADLSSAEVDRLISAGSVDLALMAVLTDERIAQAFTKFRAQNVITARDAVQWFGKDIPGVNPKIGVAFDTLNPKVVEAVKRLDTEMIRGLADEIRQTVRTTVHLGLEAGINPRETARSLRSVLGLGPKQAEAVANFEAALRGVKEAGNPLSRALRDKRFDATVKKGNLTEAQIQKMVDAYRRRMIAFNAETNARTATLDALKLGQELSWRDAIDKGFVPGETLMKQWKGVMDDREREEHIAMEGETVPFDQPYSNGEMVPGESTYNCRCLSIIFAGPSNG